MEINVNLDPEQVNKTVAEAIINSAIGKAIKAAIEKHLEAFTRTWDNPVEPVIKEQIYGIVRDLIDKQYRPQIEEKVKSLITDEMIEGTFTKLWDAFKNK